MKQLFIVRHAKSDQSFFGNDFERPLNERGRADAPVMAKRMLDKKYTIDALVSSPAARAKKTAELFSETCKIPASEIIYISALYHASQDIFYEVISALPDELNTVRLIKLILLLTVAPAATAFRMRDRVSLTWASLVPPYIG